MTIRSLRENEYTGGDFVIEEELANGSKFQQYVVSYFSEGYSVKGVFHNS